MSTTVDATHCAVCRRKLPKRDRAAIAELGEATCEICGVVMFVCATCFRERPERSDAIEARLVAHVSECREICGAHA